MDTIRANHPPYALECGDPSRTKKLGFGARPALLLLDLTHPCLSPSSPVVTTAFATIETLIEKARDSNTPIIFASTLYTRPSAADAGLLALKSPAHLFQALEQHPNAKLRPQPDDIILKKKHPSPFFGTNLATILASMGIDTLVIAGFLTSGSVRAAALDAMQSGFRPMVVAEGCADLGDETHWANLMDVGAKYGDVVGIAEVAEQLTIVRPVVA